jgi:hypothetical protein
MFIGKDTSSSRETCSSWPLACAGVQAFRLVNPAFAVFAGIVVLHGATPGSIFTLRYQRSTAPNCWSMSVRLSPDGN